MTRLRNLLPALLLIAATVTAALAATVIGTVQAQSTCTPVAFIRVIDGLGANVRAAPVDGQIIAGLKYADGEKIACEYRDGWYRLDSPAGWVSATYNSGRNPLLTIRTVSTLTPSPTQRATVRPSATVQPSPTRIITNTAIPPAERTHTAEQYGEQLCIQYPNDSSPAICSVFPFGTKFTSQTIPIQP